ncbi:MAG: Carbamate kinase [Candidatus Kapaibacterium sp.]|jgi:carbamate kinase|nr:MAG: Carbamate kinase [Candidatus Kapabacteria bacterium]ROL57832.1 MAG: carbamate kinase [Bacteroidetes/Chlorobi group bacterium Naka2016]
MDSNNKTALIAIGGNSLIKTGERGTLDEQFKNALDTARNIVKMVQRGWKVVITHGNGPQVGAALIRSERASSEVYTHTLDMCVATTQSEIGYLLQRAFYQSLKEVNLNLPVTVVPTMVVVDPNDPAFKNPTKPIGPFYDRKTAEERQKKLGWNIVEDANRGWRRVVPSPEPLDIVEFDVIKSLVESGVVTIALGGGGIPVYFNNGKIIGCEAVIDKDRSSALLASKLGVDLFLISTATDYVYLDFKKTTRKPLTKMTSDEAEKYLAEGHFPAGSMGPKIESAIRYLRNGGKQVLITSYEFIEDGLEGKAGTQILL